MLEDKALANNCDICRNFFKPETKLINHGNKIVWKVKSEQILPFGPCETLSACCTVLVQFWIKKNIFILHKWTTNKKCGQQVVFTSKGSNSCVRFVLKT